MDLLKILGFGEKTKSPVPSDEVSHINQEMYKKSFELLERNKTLSLLQKIDEIILGDITHLNETVNKVTSLLVTDIDFQVVALYLIDKQTAKLNRVGLSESPQAGQVQNLPYFSQLSLTNTDNGIIQAINARAIQFSAAIEGVLVPKPETENSEGSSQTIKSVFICPFVVRGEVIGAMVICMKESQEELSEYRRDLLGRLAELIGIALDNSMLYSEVQASNEKLKELDKLKDEFVSVASHELRTPMTAVKSYLWMTIDGRGGELTEKQKYYLGRAYSSVDRLIKLVNDMLNISRIESGRITVEMQNVDLVKLTQEVVEEVTPRADELQVHVTLEENQSLPGVLADSDKIKEVLFNLIGNSLKFTPKEGKITVSFSQQGDMIETKIQDTGSGIDPDNIPKLFQKFALLPDSYTTNKAVSGTGLGLYICKSIIELHKGKIWVKSQGRGKGSEFSFTLKVFNEQDQKEINDAQAQSESGAVGIIHTQL